MDEGTEGLVHRRKEQILLAAKHVFAQKGFRRTRIEEIATYLGVGKGTLYRYFTDKKALFLAVFERGVSGLRDMMRVHVEPVADPSRKFALAVKTYLEFFEGDRELIEIMMQVRSEFKDDYRRVFLATYSDYIVKVQENLRNGIRSGVFRQLDVEQTAEAIAATLQGVLQNFYTRESGPGGLVSPGGIDSRSVCESSEAPTFDAAGPRRELLTDATEAVTLLLLEGLLRRGDDSAP